MLTIECKGTPYEIGFTHGQAAKIHIERGIKFYAGLFLKNSKKEWPQVQDTARSFESTIKQSWPAYYEEMQGIADGSGRDILDIIALNVRTEIAFGQFSDGCTSLAWHGEKRAYLGQNWDWMEEQKPNLLIAKIHQQGKPSIQMVTEGGIIGKIGLNSAGVGVCLNAIKAKGVNTTHIPVHLGLRLALESSSCADAVHQLQTLGMAASAHILIADPNTAVGLEFSSSTFAQLLPDANGRVVHSNHLLLEHPGVKDTVWIEDSVFREARMRSLADKLGAEGNVDPSWEAVSRLFEDEENVPTAICRVQQAPSTSATLFNIVMDLKSKTAVVKLGRPTTVEETVTLSF